MHDFLLSIMPVTLWLEVAFHACLIAFLIKGWKKTGNKLFLLSALVTAGLLYDAFILALGTVLPAGGFLKGLSQVRYISHGGLIPLLLPICAYALNMKKTGKTIVWVITGILIALGLGSGICTGTAAESIGTVRYACDKALTPGWAYTVSTSVLAYGMVIPLIIAGIIAWIKQKTPLLFLSGFFMFAFSALGPATGNFDLIFFISTFGEVLMVLFFYLYAKKKSKA